VWHEERMQMKIYEQKLVEQKELVDVICDFCGKKCVGIHSTDYTYGFQFSTLFADWGYDSLHDDEIWEYTFCIDCSEKLYKKIKGKKSDR
jgi:hypothetical protein